MAPKGPKGNRLDPRMCGAQCRVCPFSSAGRPVKPVYGEGPRDAEGIVFAESPGSEEIAQGRLLVGATGQEFDRSLLEHGLKRSRLYLINVIACQPQGPKSDANMKRATECCRPFVLAQVKGFGPHPKVLALGGWAVYSLHGHKIPLDKGRGFVRKWSLDTMIMANWDAINRIRMEAARHERKEAKQQSQTGGANGVRGVPTPASK